MKYFLFFLIAGCLVTACGSAKKVVDKVSKREQIRFGHGGGFTGAITEYCLINNGDLYKKALGEIEKMEATRKEADECFAKCEAVQFQNMQLDSPGNIYAFIAHHRNGSVHRVTWNPHQPRLSPALVEFHNMLLTLVGEEPMTVTPTEYEEGVEGETIKKRAVLGKLKPLKQKSEDSRNKKLKKIDHKKLKKKHKM